MQVLSNIMATTDRAIRTARYGEKDYRISDERGLYLIVTSRGSKLWRFDYRHGIKPGTDKARRLTLAFGAYPDVSLKEARERRDEARKLLAQGVDPGDKRKEQKRLTETTFNVVAREWFQKWKTGKDEIHASKVFNRLENDILPWLGTRPITEITAPIVLEVLRRIEKRGAIETAHRTKGNISQIMRYAIATGRAERDPCPDLKDALQTTRKGHFPSIIDPVRVGKLIRDIEHYDESYVVRAALALAPLVFVRPSELRRARWANIDLDKGEWRFLVTKTTTEHLVPLSRQAVSILRDLFALTGHREWVFAGLSQGKPIGINTINGALRYLGYDTKKDITGHGFRAMARTLLAEELDQTPEWIEHQLAHVVPDPNGGAYNRTRYLKQRREMMQIWADYLDTLKSR
jgi:integrase